MVGSTVDQAALLASGWQRVNSTGFVDYAGPFWQRRDGDQVAMGLVIEDHHTNSHLGTVHGGLVMTFADNALGLGVVAALGGALNCSTVSLQTQFVSAAKIGEFIICYPEIVRKTRNLVFVRGLIQVEDRVVATADGIWKVLVR